MIKIKTLITLWNYYNKIDWERIENNKILNDFYEELLKEKINKLFPNIPKSTFNVINACLISETETEFINSIIFQLTPSLTLV